MNFGENSLKLKIAKIFDQVNHQTMEGICPKLLSKILIDYEVNVAHNIANHLELATFSHIVDDNELARW